MEVTIGYKKSAYDPSCGIINLRTYKLSAGM